MPSLMALLTRGDGTVQLACVGALLEVLLRFGGREDTKLVEQVGWVCSWRLLYAMLVVGFVALSQTGRRGRAPNPQPHINHQTAQPPNCQPL